MAEHTAPTRDLDSFIGILKELTTVAGTLAGQEEELARAAAAGEHHLISEIINRQQALLLQLRGLEQKRISTAASLGWENLTFRQILEQADKRESSLLEPLFIDLDRLVRRLHGAKGSADTAIRLRMRELDKIIGAIDGREADDVEFSRKNAPRHFQNKYV